MKTKNLPDWAKERIEEGRQDALAGKDRAYTIGLFSEDDIPFTQREMYVKGYDIGRVELGLEPLEKDK